MWFYIKKPGTKDHTLDSIYRNAQERQVEREHKWVGSRRPGNLLQMGTKGLFGVMGLF